MISRILMVLPDILFSTNLLRRIGVANKYIVKLLKKRSINLAFISLIFSFVAPAQSAESMLRCTAVTAFGLTEEGSLEATEGAKAQFNVAWMVDPSTGVVLVINHHDVLARFNYTVVQPGGGRNDTVLVLLGHRENAPSFGHKDNPEKYRNDLADAATGFMRIRRWSNAIPPSKAIRFIRYDSNTVTSGTCENIS